MLLATFLLSALLAQGVPCSNNVPSGLEFCAELNSNQTVAAVSGWTASVLDSNSRQVASYLIGSTSCGAPYDSDSCPDSSLSADPNCVAALKSFSCLWASAPVRDWTLGLNCEGATLPTPSVQQCQDVFTACNTLQVSTGQGADPVDQATLCDLNGPLDFDPPELSNCVDTDVVNTTATVVEYKYVVATDPASGVSSESYNPDKADNLFSTGSTTVTFTATDTAGNSQRCVYLVSVGVCTNSTDCQNGATCTDSLCVCPDLYFGAFCESEKVFCPGDSTCQGKGECDFATGTCQCFGGWSGSECDSVACPKYDGKNCNDHGICHAVGVCQCEMGWIGAICQIRIEDNGMTGGQLAGAVIGGLLFSFFCLVMLFAYLGRDESVF